MIDVRHEGSVIKPWLVGNPSLIRSPQLNAGDLRSRESLFAKNCRRISLCRSSRWDIAGQKAHSYQDADYGDEGHRVEWLDLEEKTAQKTSQANDGGKPYNSAG